MRGHFPAQEAGWGLRAVEEVEENPEGPKDRPESVGPEGLLAEGPREMEKASWPGDRKWRSGSREHCVCAFRAGAIA